LANLRKSIFILDFLLTKKIMRDSMRKSKNKLKAFFTNIFEQTILLRRTIMNNLFSNIENIIIIISIVIVLVVDNVKLVLPKKENCCIQWVFRI